MESAPRTSPRRRPLAVSSRSAPSRSATRSRWKSAFLLLAVVPVISVCGLCICSTVTMVGLGAFMNALGTGGRLSEVQKGQPAPDFTLTTLDGDTVQLSDHRGTPVLVNFWASWCGPCMRELPELQRADREFAPHELVILTVNGDNDTDAARRAVEERDVDLTVLLDPDGEVSGRYDVRSIPTNVMVDADGLVRATTSGSLSLASIRALVASAGSSGAPAPGGAAHLDRGGHEIR